MITQELIAYIRGEFSKGKTREEIRTTLLAGGGWSENDLSEAFRTVIPMQGNVAQNVIFPKEKSSQPAPSSPPTPPSVSFSPSPLPSFLPPISYLPSRSSLKSTPFSKPLSSPHSSHPLLKFLIVLIFIVGLSFGFWYYRSPIINLWNASVNKVLELSTPSFNENQDTGSNNVAPDAVTQPVAQVRNCGIVATPKLGFPSTYENDSGLSCLGESAAICVNAKGILRDDFFPTVFEITKLQASCNFKLSYPADSALTDITGRKLALQYIICPINIVKAIDNTNVASPKFIAPDTTNFSRYASQIYFYGTLGLFVENNLDKNEMEALGCNGPYIDSMIASYNKMQAGN